MKTNMHWTVAMIFATALAGSTASVGHTADAGEAELRNSIDSLMKPLVEKKGGWFGGNPDVVGMVVGIIRGDEEMIATYGAIDHESEIAPDAETVFEIGSITKTFTGALLAEAIARGEVALDDPVRRHLPDEAITKRDGDEEMTLRQLATHTSGLPRVPSNLNPKSLNDPYADYHPENMWKYFAKRGLERKDDSWDYSNLGGGLLGQILVESAGAADYESLVADRISGPLGLAGFRVRWSDADRKRQATPYRKWGKRTNVWKFDALAGAGALHSSLNDMLGWARANMVASGTGSAIAAAHEPLEPVNDVVSIGMMWLSRELDRFEGPVLFHDGGTGGSSSVIFVAPGEKTAVVILTNTVTDKLIPLGDELLHLAAGIERGE